MEGVEKLHEFIVLSVSFDRAPDAHEDLNNVVNIFGCTSIETEELTFGLSSEKVLDLISVKKEGSFSLEIICQTEGAVKNSLDMLSPLVAATAGATVVFAKVRARALGVRRCSTACMRRPTRLALLPHGHRRGAAG